MRKVIYYFILLAATELVHAGNPLQKAINDSISKVKAKVAVSVDFIPQSKGRTQHVGINENDTMTTMSVIKFAIGVSALHAVELKKIHLSDKVFFDSIEMKRTMYSPLRESHKEPFETTLEEALSYAVSKSDNSATDKVMDAMKGTSNTQEFLDEKGFTCMQIGTYYRNMTPHTIRKNWSTAACMNRLLLDFYNGKLLNKENTSWLFMQMLNTTTAPKRLKGKLPEGTAVAHKTGTMYDDSNPNYEEAINDVGIIKLPNGSTIILSVFVNDSYISPDDTEALIATISKLCYDYYLHQK